MTLQITFSADELDVWMEMKDQEVSFMASVDNQVKEVKETVEIGKFLSKRNGNAVQKFGKTVKEGYTDVMAEKLQGIFKDGRKLISMRPFKISSKSREKALITSYWKCSHNMSISITCPWKLFRTGADLKFNVSSHKCAACEKENQNPLSDYVDKIRTEGLSAVDKHINDYFDLMTARAGTGMLEKVLESTEELGDGLKKLISDTFRKARDEIIGSEAETIKNAMKIQKEHHALPSTTKSSASKAIITSATGMNKPKDEPSNIKPTKNQVLACNLEDLPDEMQSVIEKIQNEEVLAVTPGAETEKRKLRKRRNAVD